MQKKNKSNNVFLINRKFLMIQHKKLYDSKKMAGLGVQPQTNTKI